MSHPEGADLHISEKPRGAHRFAGLCTPEMRMPENLDGHTRFSGIRRSPEALEPAAPRRSRRLHSIARR
jgi:hypothetical protein